MISVKKKAQKMLVVILLVGLFLTACGSEEKNSSAGEEKEATPTVTSMQIQTGGDVTETPTPSVEAEATDAPAPTGTEGTDPAPTESGVVTVAPPNSGDGTGSGDGGTFTAEDCRIVIAGVTLAIGEDFLPYVETIGDAQIVEGQACLDGGYDTNYYYGDSLAVYTYAQNGKQIIYDIYITGSEYATQKGAQVGVTTREALYELYGTATDSFLATERYQLAGSDIMVSFVFSGEVLESIDILDSGVNG